MTGYYLKMSSNKDRTIDNPTERVEMLARELELNDSELGRLVGRNRQDVYAWKNGTKFSALDVYNFSKRANVNPAYLIFGKPPIVLSASLAARKAAEFVSSLPPEYQERALLLLETAFRK